MSIHYAPLLIGVAIGAAVTYVLKDEKAKNSIQSGLQKTGETLSSGVDSVTSEIEKSVEKVVSGFSKGESGQTAPPMKDVNQPARSTRAKASRSKAKPQNTA